MTSRYSLPSSEPQNADKDGDEANKYDCYGKVVEPGYKVSVSQSVLKHDCRKLAGDSAPCQQNLSWGAGELRCRGAEELGS